MAYLSAVTLLWAFSFSLIGVYLAGQVDSWFSVFMRVALASVVFIPFLKFRGVSKSLIAKLMIVGGFQLGLMYCFYYQSFLLLSVPEVLLFTVFTPIYVTLIYDFLKGRFSPWYLVTALIAVAGAAWIKFAGINENFLMGFLVVQGANLCFAIGQVGYKSTAHRVWLLLLGCALCSNRGFRAHGQPRQTANHRNPMGHFDLPWFDCIRLWLLCVEQRGNLSECWRVSGNEQRVSASRPDCEHRNLEPRRRHRAPRDWRRDHHAIAVD